nr:hypothetical protein [Parashewanella spongiae]
MEFKKLAAWLRRRLRAYN